MKKKYYLFVILTLFLIGCDKELNIDFSIGNNNSDYVLDSNKYQDIILVSFDDLIIKDNDLYYIVDHNNQRSVGYSFVKTMFYYNEIDSRYHYYYLVKTIDNKNMLIDSLGNEKSLQYEYSLIYEYLNDKFIGITNDEKYVIVSFDGTESPLYEDMYVVRGFDYKTIIAYNIDEFNNYTYFLYNNNGDIIINGSERIEHFLLTNSTNHTPYISIKTDNGYRVAYGNGEFIDDELYTMVSQTENNIVGIKDSDDYQHFVFYNNKYEKISVDTISIGKPPYEIYKHDNAIIYHDDLINKDIIKTFSGGELIFDSVEKPGTLYYICHKDDKIIFIDRDGNELYSEVYDPNKKPTVFYNYYNFWVYSKVNNFYMASSENKSITLINDFSSKSTINVELGMSNGVFNITVTTNGVSKTSLFSLEYTNATKLSELIYYEDIYVCYSSVMPFAIIKDTSKQQLTLLDLNTFQETYLGEINSFFFDWNINFMEIKKDNTIFFSTFEVLYKYGIDEVKDSYIIYKDQVNESTAESNLKVKQIGTRSKSDINYMYNFIFINEVNKSNIYKFDFIEDHYELKSISSIDLQVASIMIDKDSAYIITKHIFNNQNIYYGLNDIEGNVILNPEYFHILGIQNSNVIIQDKDENNRVIQINSKDIKTITDIDYHKIKFIGDGNFVAEENDGDKYSTFYIFNSSGNKEQIKTYTSLTYLTVVSDKIKYVEAYKIDFGEYVQLYFNNKELNN